MSDKEKVITPGLVAAAALSYLSSLQGFQHSKNKYWQEMSDKAVADRKAWWASMSRWQKFKYRAGRVWGRVCDYSGGVKWAAIDLGRALIGRDYRDTDW